MIKSEVGDISIKLVENDDLLEVVLLKQAESMDEQIPQELVWERALKMKYSHGHHFWIARVKSEPVGYAMGFKNSNWYQSLDIFVKKDHRNLGIGLALKKAQIEFAKNLGCAEIRGEFVDANKAYKKVHEKAGFKFEQRQGYVAVSLRL